MNTIRKRIITCAVAAWTVISLPAAEYGVLYLQNGDLIPAQIHEVASDHLEVKIPGEDDPVSVLSESPFIWIAGEGASAKEPQTGTVDVLTLPSGQAFYGKLQQVDPEHIRFTTLWNQEFQLKRDQVSRVELNQPVPEPVRVGNNWEITNRYGKGSDVTSEWRQTGRGYFHSFPRVHVWRQHYSGAYPDVRIEYRITFPEKPKTYSVSVSNPGNAADRQRIEITYYARKGLIVRDSLLSRNSFTIPLDESDENKDRTHHVVLDYSAETKRLTLYFNGKQKKEWGGLIDQEGAPLLSNPLLTLVTNEPGPVQIEQLGVFPRKPGEISPGRAVTSQPVRFTNGDTMDAEILGFDGTSVTLDLAGRSLQLPSERMTTLTFSSHKDPVPSDPMRISLRQPHPDLLVNEIKMTDDGKIELLLYGLATPCVLSVQDIGSIEWPLQKEPDFQDTLFHFRFRDGTFLSGQIEALTDKTLQLRPGWTNRSLTRPTSGIEQILRPDPPRRTPREPPSSTVVLRNGDYILGTLEGFEKGALVLRQNAYERTRVDPGHLRMVIQEGNSPGENWVFDPMQAVAHIQAAKSSVYRMPGLTPTGDIEASAQTRLSGLLPRGPNGVHMHLVFTEPQNLKLSLQLDRGLRQGKPKGLTLVLSQNKLLIFLQGGRPATRLKPGTSQVKSLDLFFHPVEKRLCIFLNGIKVYDKSDLDISLDPTLRMYNLSGIQQGTRIQDFSVKPVLNQEWVPQVAEKPAEGIEIWIDNQFAGFGSLSAGNKGGVHYQTPDMKEAAPLPKEAMFGLRFFHPEPYPEPAEELSVILQLQDQTTRLYGSAVSISDGMLRLTHPAFPDGFNVPVSEVRALFWGKPPPFNSNRASGWRR